MRAVSGAASLLRHVAGAGAEGFLVAAIAATLVVVLAPVYAGAGHLAGDASAGAAANTIEVVGSSGSSRIAVQYGDTVTTRATLARDYYLVYVRVTCVQGASTVYEAWANIKTGTWTTNGLASFALTGPSWTGGAASCQADLLNAVMKGGHRVYKTLATVGFAVGG